MTFGLDVEVAVATGRFTPVEEIDQRELRCAPQVSESQAAVVVGQAIKDLRLHQHARPPEQRGYNLDWDGLEP
jgi:hypothetical protein